MWYNLQSRKILVSRDVLFLEEDFSFKNLLHSEINDESFQETSNFPIAIVHGDDNIVASPNGSPDITQRVTRDIPISYEILIFSLGIDELIFPYMVGIFV